MSRLSRRKGKLGEQEAAQLLRPAFPEVRTKRAGGESALQDRGRDLLGTPGLCVQVMLSASPAIERKFREACDVALPNEIPVALTRRTCAPGENGKGGPPWLATLPAEALVKLLSDLSHLRALDPDLTPASAVGFPQEKLSL